MAEFGLKRNGRFFCTNADCEKEDGKWGFNLDLTQCKPNRRIVSCVDCGAKLNVDEYVKRNRKLVKKTIEGILEVEHRLYGDRIYHRMGQFVWYRVTNI